MLLAVNTRAGEVLSSSTAGRRVTLVEEFISPARVAAIREAIGPDIHLMIDANQGYNAAAAIRLARRVADLALLDPGVRRAGRAGGASDFPGNDVSSRTE